jgi:hypothetical protein
MIRTIIGTIVGIAVCIAAAFAMAAGLTWYAYSKGVAEIHIGIQSIIACFLVFWAALLSGRIARRRAVGVALFTGLAFEVVIAAANRWGLAQIELLQVSGDPAIYENRVWIAGRMILAALAGLWGAAMWARKSK